MKMVKAVLFDLDGVITDTAEYHYCAWKKLAEQLGISFDRAFNENLKGVSRKNSLDLILQHGNKENQYTLKEKEDLMEEKNTIYLEMIEQLTPEAILPGIHSLLEDLKEKGMKIGLASASKNGSMILEKLEIATYFDTIANPAKVKRGKPFPDLYLTAAKQLNVEPQDCVGIEDAKSGVEAILAANMVAIGVGDKETLQDAQYVVENTEQLNTDLILSVWSKGHES